MPQVCAKHLVFERGVKAVLLIVVRPLIIEPKSQMAEDLIYCRFLLHV